MYNCDFLLENATPTPRDLYNYIVTKHATNWREIGGELGLKPEVVNNIAANFQTFDSSKHENCLKEVFKFWLRADTNASWKKLEVALTNVSRAQRGLNVISNMYGECIYQ